MKSIKLVETIIVILLIKYWNRFEITKGIRPKRKGFRWLNYL